MHEMTRTSEKSQGPSGLYHFFVPYCSLAPARFVERHVACSKGSIADRDASISLLSAKCDLDFSKSSVVPEFVNRPMLYSRRSAIRASAQPFYFGCWAR